MARPRTLTDEQRRENAKKINNESTISIKIDSVTKSRVTKFWRGRYESRNAALIDLIKTHPDFVLFKKQIQTT